MSKEALLAVEQGFTFKKKNILNSYALFLSNVSGNTSCWISANIEAINNELLSVQSKRIALGTNMPLKVLKTSISYHELLLLHPCFFHYRTAEKSISMATQPGIPSGHAAAFSFNCKSKPCGIQNTYTDYNYTLVLKPN